MCRSQVLPLRRFSLCRPCSVQPTRTTAQRFSTSPATTTGSTSRTSRGTPCSLTTGYRHRHWAYQESPGQWSHCTSRPIRRCRMSYFIDLHNRYLGMICRYMTGRIRVEKGSMAAPLCAANPNATTTARGNKRARGAPCYIAVCHYSSMKTWTLELMDV